MTYIDLEKDEDYILTDIETLSQPVYYLLLVHYKSLMKKTHYAEQISIMASCARISKPIFEMDKEYIPMITRTTKWPEKNENKPFISASDSPMCFSVQHKGTYKRLYTNKKSQNRIKLY